MRTLACCLVVVLCACSPAPEPSKPQPKPIPHEDVNAFVTLYIARTNAGETARAMTMIEKSKDVTSITGAKVTHGWDAIREATERNARQPAPGKVALGDMEVFTLGPDTALASGPMRIGGGSFQIGNRTVNELGGAYTIVVKRTPEGLKVIHEHFSVRAL